MEYKQIEQLVNNYIHESDFYDSQEEYTEKHNIISEDLDTFNFLLKVEQNILDKELKSLELEKVFNNCISFQAENIKDNKKFIIFHPCTREGYKYQLSYFDQYGAIMDEKSTTIKEAIENYYHLYKQYIIKKVIAC